MPNPAEPPRHQPPTKWWMVLILIVLATLAVGAIALAITSVAANPPRP